jgi:hypothetical protein
MAEAGDRRGISVVDKAQRGEVAIEESPPAALPARAEREAILSRARALVASQSVSDPVRQGNSAARVVQSTRSGASTGQLALRRQVPAEPALPVGQRVRLQMFCSAASIGYIGNGLEYKGEVQLVGAELPSRGNGGDKNAPLLRCYTYIGALREWNCPVCRVAHAGVEAFGCACACFSDVLHCGGRVDGGNVYCACGEYGQPEFRSVSSLPVRGHASANAPAAPLRRGGQRMHLLTGPPQAPQPLLPRCLR